jgi:hypothetical protein
MPIKMFLLQGEQGRTFRQRHVLLSLRARTHPYRPSHLLTLQRLGEKKAKTMTGGHTRPGKRVPYGCKRAGPRRYDARTLPPPLDTLARLQAQGRVSWMWVGSWAQRKRVRMQSRSLQASLPTPAMWQGRHGLKMARPEILACQRGCQCRRQLRWASRQPECRSWYLA